MRPDPPPPVSVAVPLFRSNRFLSRILDNIRAIDYPEVEIILSDRHCADDALDALRRELRGDSRVVFVERRDRSSWVDHYNSLLRMASGGYFMWMPHDDSFPADYIPRLVAALEARPRALLAFGAVDAVDPAGEPLAGVRFYPPPFSGSESRGLADSLRLLFWGGGIPFRGVFRREAILRRGLEIRPTRESVGADTYWVFGLSLVGGLAYVPECRCAKRYDPGGESASSRYGARHVADGVRVLRSYIRDLAGGRGARLMATLGVLAWGLSQAAGLALGALPESVKPLVGRAVLRMHPRGIRPGLSRFR